MEKSKAVKSFVKPKAIWLDKYHVYTAENIKQVEVDSNGEKEKQYEFDLTTYDKDEYIILEMQKNKQENQLAIAQLAMQMGGIQNG
ncbi:hypothetical protein LTY62_08045 [Limosilactobacillus balticus]|uniref:hypothetical protein n=1 Tax=Limosilactobacillus balticus TaxID=2759747 RepID=UPI001E533E0D|nr:hypothetical protein [Limosilactobacillus balticus]MCD7137193.1 hypothetical protein [Limosilactobacillus balticus]